MTIQRIAVLGTGANGAGIGADFVRAGYDVTFVEQWPAHVEAMRNHGVRVVMPDRTQTTDVQAIHLCEVAELREDFDLVFLLVKAYDTRWAAELIRPVLAPDALVVGLQNGMQADDIADIVGAHRALGAVIEVSSNMFEPGIVHRQSPPEKSWFAIGSLSASSVGREQEVADVLRAAGTVEISPDIRSSKWMKLVANAAELVPSAILGVPLSEAVALPGVRSAMIEIGREAIAACLASGSTLIPIFGMTAADISTPDDYAVRLLDTVLDQFTLPDTRTTVLQDWMKGRRSEVQQINGHVVNVLRELGRPSPWNERVLRMALDIESGRIKAGIHNRAELVAA